MTKAKALDVGIAFDLKVELEDGSGGPVDRLEEYDSAETIDAIARAIESHGHTARKLGGGRRFIEEMLRRPPDLVFNIAEGRNATRSREAQVPAVAEMLGVPITHSDPLTLALSLDKALAKRVVASMGVPTPRFALVEHPDQAESLDLSMPVIAKPAAEGSSMGVRKSSRFDDPRALPAAVAQLLADYKQPVLVEEFCTGPEFTVGVLGTGAAAEVIAVMEIVPRKATAETFIYSLEVKHDWQNEVEYKVPPQRPRDLLKEVERVALGAHRALGCRDLSRVDIRVSSDGTPMFLEVNPLPGLNPVTGDVVILSERSGLRYDALIGRVVALAAARYGLK